MLFYQQLLIHHIRTGCFVCGLSSLLLYLIKPLKYNIFSTITYLSILFLSTPPRQRLLCTMVVSLHGYLQSTDNPQYLHVLFFLFVKYTVQMVLNNIVLYLPVNHGKYFLKVFQHENILKLKSQ